MSDSNDVVASVDFPRQHRSATSLLLPCQAGLSRSRSVAVACCEFRGWPYEWTVLHAPLLVEPGESLQYNPR